MRKINLGLNQSRLFLRPSADANGEMIKNNNNNTSKNNNSES